MAKTYVPTLRVVAESAYRYGSRWQAKLIPNLTTEQITCFTAWLAATLELVNCLGRAPVDP